MRRYADLGHAAAGQRPAHWSDRLEPDAPWVELNFQISASPAAWAEQGVPPEQVQARFAELVERIKDEAVALGIAEHVTVSPELRGPLV